MALIIYVGSSDQISYTVYRIVTALASNSRNISKFEVESLGDEAEDLNIYYQDGSVERIQIKKKDEAYQWLPSELYSAHTRTRKSAGSMTRKLSVT